MNNFFTRVLTALLFGIIAIAGIYYSEFSIIGLFSLITFLCLIEYYKLMFSHSPNENEYWSPVVGTAVFITIIMALSGISRPNILALNVLFITLIFIIQLYSKYERPFRSISYKLSGLIYIAIPFALFCGLGFIHHPDVYNYELTLGFIFLLWANDTGAYLVGVKFGKNRLFERISPKKSWEGFIGGLILSVGIAVLLDKYFHTISLENWIVCSLLIVVFGTFGDLVESMLKRSHHIKDSGSILPGHGGVLDRFDGLLLAAPIVYAYLVLFS